MLQISNDELQTRSTSLAKGLIAKGGLVPDESNVLVVLNDSIGKSIYSTVLKSTHVVPENGLLPISLFRKSLFRLSLSPPWSSLLLF
jgi:hypothetical protein